MGVGIRYRRSGRTTVSGWRQFSVSLQPPQECPLYGYCRHFGIDEDRIAAALGHANEAKSPQSEGRLFREIIDWEDVQPGARRFIDKHLKAARSG